MPGIAQHLLCCAALDNLPAGHDRDGVGHVPDHPQIMRD